MFLSITIYGFKSGECAGHNIYHFLKGKLPKLKKWSKWGWNKPINRWQHYSVIFHKLYFSTTEDLQSLGLTKCYDSPTEWID